MRKFENPTVEAVFANYPAEMKIKMMALRQVNSSTLSKNSIRTCWRLMGTEQ